MEIEMSSKVTLPDGSRTNPVLANDGHVGGAATDQGPHLHFELRLYDQVVDPMRYLVPLVVTPATTS